MLLVLSVVGEPRALVARLGSHRWLVWCGRISYSLYLVHPVVLVVAVSGHQCLGPWRAIAVSFLLATALHRFVEQPLRRGAILSPRPHNDSPKPALA